jgi:hypothetical protein
MTDTSNLGSPYDRPSISGGGRFAQLRQQMRNWWVYFGRRSRWALAAVLGGMFAGLGHRLVSDWAFHLFWPWW